MVLGGPGEFAAQEATLMVGPTTNDDPDSTMPESSLGVSGNKPTAIKTRGNTYIEGDLYVTGSVDCLSTGRLEARHSVADALPKKFDIVHPSLGEGNRLAHACIEGAEVGVYHRGRVKNDNFGNFFSNFVRCWQDLLLGHLFPNVSIFEAEIFFFGVVFF